LVLVETTNAVWKKVYLLKELRVDEAKLIINVLKNDLTRLVRVHEYARYVDEVLKLSLTEELPVMALCT